MQGGRSRTVHVGADHVEVEELGRGDPPVVLLHGMGHDRGQVAGMAAGLVAGRRAVVYDTVRLSDFTLPRQAEVLDAVVAAVGGDRAVVGGVSMGAAVSLTWALANPDRASAVVQVAPALIPTGLPPTAADYVWWLADTVEGGGFAALRRELSRLPADHASGQLAELGRWEARFDEETLVRLWRTFPGAPAFAGYAELARLSAPTLVVAWPGDALHPLEVAERYVDALPAGELAVVAPPSTADLPAAAADAVVAFVERVTR